MLEANPGGAPCNVLAMLEKLGKKTAFIGKVGNDMFGTQLKNAVEEVGYRHPQPCDRQRGTHNTCLRTYLS